MAQDDHSLPFIKPRQRFRQHPVPTWPPVTPSPSTVNAAAAKYARIGGAAAVGKALPIIYGKQRVEGRVFYYQPYLPTGSPVYVGVTIGVGEIEEVTTVRVNGFPLPAGGIDGLSYVTYLGTTAGNADSGVYATVNSNFYSTWKFPGIAYAVFTIDPRLVPFETIDSFAFDVKGLKVKDFRTGSTAYSANAALCLWDFLTHARHGCKRPEALMDDADSSSSWWVAADLCDEVVDSEARYELNIAITEQATAESLLEMLRAHCAADIFFQKGLWRCVIESEREPVLAFDDSSNCRDVTISTLPSADKPTSVTITFPNPDKEYEEDVARFPEAAVTGLQIGETSYSLQGCRAKQAKRLAAIYQRKGQFEEYLADFIAGPEAVRLVRRDIVTLTTQDGLVAQEFDVLDMEQLDTGEYRISAREHDPAAYSDDAQATDTLVEVTRWNPFEAPPEIPYAVNVVPAAPDEEDWGYNWDGGSEARPKSNLAGVYWPAPRVYKTATLYGAAYWSVSGPGAGLTLDDASKVCDDDWSAGSGAAATFADVGPGDGLILDLGAGNDKAFAAVRFACAGSGGTFHLNDYARIYYSADAVTWTEMPFEVIRHESATVHMIEFASTATSRRYWMLSGESFDFPTNGIVDTVYEVQFLEYDHTLGLDVLSHYRLEHASTGAWLGDVPANKRPTIDTLFPILPLATEADYFSQPSREVNVLVKPVTRWGVPSAIGTLVYRVSTSVEDKGNDSVSVVRQPSAASIVKQKGNAGIDGELEANDLHADSRILLDSAPSAPVSGAGQIALRDNAGTLEQSVNGGAYAALGGGSLTVKESDGSPSVANVTEIRVSGATVTDEGGGAVTVTVTPGGGGGVALVTDEFTGAGGASQDLDLSADLATDDEASLVGVFYEGVLQDPSLTSIVDANTITQTPAPASGVAVTVVFFATLPTGVTGVHVEEDTGDGSTTDFPLAQTAIANGLVGGHVEGVRKGGVTLIDGNTKARYATAPPNGAAVHTVILY